MTKLKDTPPGMTDLGRKYRRMEQGFKEYRVFLTAVELGLFDRLMTQISAEDLAEQAGIHAGMTGKLLDVLTALGFIVKTAAGYCNTKETTAFLTREGAFFSSGSVSYLKENSRKFSGLTDRLTLGPEQKRKKSHTYKPDTIRTMANTCLLGRLQEIVGIVTALPGFETARRMMDIGGAHGLFAIAMCQENPRLSAVVFDQPPVTDITNEYIAAYHMQDRVTTMAGDHGTDRFSAGFDLIFESFTFFGDKPKLAGYFARIHDALNRGGLLISVRSVLEDNRQGPLPALLWALSGAMESEEEKHHTRSALFSILEETGFSGMQLVGDSPSLAGDYQIITARKP
ncbi:methyltransferase [Desulfocicer niacini]